MASRRQAFRDYYRRSPSLRTPPQPYQDALDRIKLSGVPHDSANRYRYRGASEEDGVVVRFDLNGYSKWAREQPLDKRVLQLDQFFSGVVPIVDDLGGVFFRDEGDCIVCLFSTYFTPWLNTKLITHIGRCVVGQRYGELTAKGSVAAGRIAIFQKAHERGSDDWSAEGEPFVRAARLEQGVDSGQRVHYFADDYARLFSSPGTNAPSGGIYHWEIEPISKRIEGLSLPGGWTDLFVETFIESGRVAA